MKRTIKGYSIRVNTEKTSDLDKTLLKRLSQRIVGQPRAIQHIARLMVSAESGLRDLQRPIGTMIFAGPSGCGKTLTAKELARTLIGSLKGFTYPLTIIQCSNLAESHRVSTLIGSPPGYVDSHKIPVLHRFNIEKYGLISFLEEQIRLCKDEEQRQEKQDALEQVKRCLQALQVGKVFIKYNKQDLNIYTFLNELFEKAQPLISIILFDEIEKAHPDVWNLLLSIMEEGQLQLANNGEMTSFANSLIILTTNTGSREIQGVFGINRMGFQTPTRDEDREKMDKAVYDEAKKALEKMFPPELMGRLGKEVIAFRGLQKEDFNQIFHQLVDEFRWRLKEREIAIRCAPKFRKFVVEEGFNQKYGARILRDAVKKYVETPISFAISSGELKRFDNVLLTLENGQPVLRRQPRPSLKKEKVVEKVKEDQNRPEPRRNGHDEYQNKAMFSK